METLSRQLHTRIGAASTIIAQEKMPGDLAHYDAVLVYIHHDITPTAEQAFIRYAEGGGKLVLLHHSISSAKRKNKQWFPFLAIALPEGPVEDGGYKYYAPASFAIVNLAPGNSITTGGVDWPEKVAFQTDVYAAEERPAFTVSDTEVYLNHLYDGTRTILLGLKYTAPKSRKTFMQATAGWVRTAKKGKVMYFMLGHRPEDFDIPIYAQILANAVASR